jgi:hypothetical protein
MGDGGAGRQRTGFRADDGNLDRRQIRSGGPVTD